MSEPIIPLSLAEREAEAARKFQACLDRLQEDYQVDIALQIPHETIELCRRFGFIPLPPQLVFKGRDNVLP